MPIRINLLAEAQAAAEMRRKDPVKRGIWVGSFLICLVLLWIAKLYLDNYFEQKNYNHVYADWLSKTNKYAEVTNQNGQIGMVEQKLKQLEYLSTNRFLWAPILNALQKTVDPNVHVIKLIGEQKFAFEYPHDVGSGPTLKHLGKATVETDTLTIDAKDYKPSEQHSSKYKDALCSCDFFVQRLQRRDGFVLTSLGPLTPDPVDLNKQFVEFTLVARFPEIRREEK